MPHGPAIVLAVTVGLCHCVVLDLGRNNRIEVNLPWLPYDQPSNVIGKRVEQLRPDVRVRRATAPQGAESLRKKRQDVNKTLEGETRCYDELGCLNITRDWYHLIYRPFNVFPLPREVIDTRFVLYTRKNPVVGQTLKAGVDKTIQKSNLDAKKETKLIVHGFIDTPLSSWVKEMRRELLKHSDWNVVVVDWAGGSLPLYTQATANTRLVGLEIAFFINHLKEKYGLKPEDVHIIGHSLGAHTAGYAGERVDGLGRITGLDPAEPYFQGMPAQIRLDPTDAGLVDVIHTDGSSIFLLESWIRDTRRALPWTPSVSLPSIGYGMSEPCGHIDFYPNNGKEQPGCDLGETPPLPLTLIKEGIEEASRVLVACNHIRAIKLFTESINSQCPYIAHRCSSYQHFLQGRCFSCSENGTGCAVMGLNVQKGSLSPGSKYFVTTGKKEPYCRYHYRVTLDLAKPPKAESWVQGFMKVTLHSDNSIARSLDLTPSGYERFQHGTSRSFVVTHTDNIGPVQKVDLYWEYDMDVLQPRSICFLWCNDHLYVSSVKVEETRDVTARDKRATEVSSKLCSSGRDYAEIPSRGTMLFTNQCDETETLV